MALSSSDASKPPAFQRSESNDFHDPVLQYINDLLMEEEEVMEDQNCTLHESIAYQATVKSFSDILNDKIEHTSSSTVTYGETFRVSEEDFHLLSTVDGYDSHESNEPCAARIEVPMTKGLLNKVSVTGSMKPSETEFRLQQETTACVSNESFKQLFSNEGSIQKTLNTSLSSQISNEILKQKMLDGILKPPVPSSLRQHVSDYSSDGHLYLPRSTRSTRIKRQSPEENNCNDDDICDGQENTFSFVQNETLKPEEYAKDLNEGLSKIIEKLKNSGPITSVASKSHKSNAGKLATTADLKHMLLSCAQAVADGNTRIANEILKEIRQEATPYGDDLQRLAHYFAEGLVARITGTGAMVYTALSNNVPSLAKWLKAHRLFVDSSPYHRISNLFTNRAIVESAKDSYKLHIIDYGIWYGLQWPSLISALAERKGGPPFLRMTMIEFPDPGSNPARNVEWIGKKLSEYAYTYGVPFEYQAIADQWENITASTIGLRDGEILVVNSSFTLHKVPDESLVQSDPRTIILKNILEMNPKLFVYGVSNGSYSSPFFVPRFREALSHFSYYFDMMEAIAPRDNQDRFLYERELFGKQIINVVACEGHERERRPTTYKQWQNKIQRVGFGQLFLDKKMVKDVQDAVRLHYNNNFFVDSDGNWMLVGWKGKVNLAMTLWRPEYK